MSAFVHCPQCGYNGQNNLPLSFGAIDLAVVRMDELSRSNNPPLQAERVHLEGVIGEGRGFLAGLQERIAQARAALDVLLDEEKRVEAMIESCKTIVRPIRRIPEDIIREIFLTSFERVEMEGKDSLDGSFEPLVLSQVCRDWRSIALSTSRLWSSIKLDFDRYRNELACQYLLQTYLLLSGTHDITLSIHSTKDILESHLIPVLLCAPRWTNVSLSIPYYSLHAFSAARGSLHRLNRLSIEFIGRIPGLPVGLAKPIFDAFEYAPLLRSFSLKGVSRSVRQINIPWSQLTEYNGNDWTSCYIEILKLAPNTESASLQCDEHSEFDETPPLSSHEHLRILHVHEEDPDLSILEEGGITRFLSHIEFPALESLRMTYAHPYIRIPTSLHGSTAGNLKSLSINIPLSISLEVQADLISLLKTTASLSSLSMSYRLVPTDPENERLLLGLNANINPDVVPRLTSLAIQFTNKEPYLSPLFVDMVQSRRPAGLTRTTLQTLRLSAPFVIPPVDSDVAARWKDLCDEGFVMYGME